ncbi:MAG: hypothetical protein H0T43_12190, partial [Solirubrobacterales bacterium]|nr:hypothetical protein [Solirubrobacterales bacterium]
MAGGEYVVGATFALATVGGVLGAAAIVVRRHLAHLHGAPLALASAVVVTAGLIAVLLVPGALGVLSREAAAITAALGLLAAWRVPPHRSVAVGPAEPRGGATRRGGESPLAWA